MIEIFNFHQKLLDDGFMYLEVGDKRSVLGEESIFDIFPKEVEANCKKHGVYRAIKNHKIGDRVYYKSCPLCEKIKQEKRERERQEKEEQEYNAWLEGRLLTMGVGKRYLANRGNFDTQKEVFNTQNKGVKLLELLKVENGDFVNKDSFTLFGACGCGKTFLASKMVELSIENKRKYRLITSRDLISIYDDYEDWGSGYHRRKSMQNIKDFVNNLDCLIIDESDDILSMGETALMIFQETISILYNNNTRFGILGNCSFGDFLNALNAKTKSRLSEGINFSCMGAKDLRNSKKI